MSEQPNDDDLDVFRVGGSVRDELVGKEPNDDDFVVVGATEQEMLDRGFDQPVGESFAVFIHPETGDEWALARTEQSTGDSYKDFEVQASPDVSLEEDLRRRDLTINAMARDVDTGELIDPHGGREDVDRGVLRHVSEAFAEDPLRVIRVATFAARLPEFDVHPETADLCRDLVPQLETIAPQRIQQEMFKCFEKAEEPRRFFDTLDAFGALETVFPHIAEMKAIPAGPEEFHAEGSTFEHTMRVIEEAHALDPNNRRLLLAALGHDMGKLATDASDLPNHPKHEKTGPTMVDEFGDTLKMPNTERRVMKTAARLHMRFHKLDELREATLIRMVKSLGEPNLTIEEFINLGIADGLGREPREVGFEANEARAHLEAAQHAIDSFGGEEAFEKFDLDPSDGEKIGDLILQERIRLLKENRPE